MRLGGLWQGVSALGEGPGRAKLVGAADSVGGVETDSAGTVETGSVSAVETGSAGVGGALKVSKRPNPTKP